MSKLIDEKGRLFGKINIVDLLVLAYLFLLIPPLFFARKILKKGVPETTISKQTFLFETDIPCDMVDVNTEEISLVKMGDIEKNEKGEVIGKLTKLGKPEAYTEAIDIDSKLNIELKVVSHQWQIPVRLHLKVFSINGVIYYKNKKNFVKSNAYLTFKTDKYEKRCHFNVPDKIKSLKTEKVLESTPAEPPVEPPAKSPVELHLGLNHDL